MSLRVRCNRNIKVTDARQTRDQVRPIRKSVRVRLPIQLPLRRIATQGYQVANALVPVFPRDVEDFAL